MKAMIEEAAVGMSDGAGREGVRFGACTRTAFCDAPRASLEPLAVYVHTPFCPTKCGYCDFNSFAGLEALHERTVDAIVEELRRSPLRGRPAKTVFFGGGTPTFLQEKQIERLLQAVLEAHPPQDGCEITSEANPGTVDIPKFDAMRRMGFNRISLGAQSFSDADLERLGRVHRSADVERAFRAARTAGFENLNLDLMFALPEQTLEDWRANLEKAVGLGPEHLSLYCLTLEPNTRFYKLHARGRLTQPDEELQVRMYEAAVTFADRQGYAQYEISNFARPGMQCRHNLAYWRGEEYAGYGPGAVGCARGLGLQEPAGLAEADRSVLRCGTRAARQSGDFAYGSRPWAPKVRYTNVKHPLRYCQAVERGLILWCDWEEVDAEKARMETIMLGLRLNEGLPFEALDEERDGVASGDPSCGDVSTLRLSTRVLQGLVAKGWIEVREGRVFLTPSGRHWCSEVALALV